MQVRHDDHTSLAINLKEQFERSARSIDEDEDAKNFFQLFLEGSTQTLEESLPALLYMNQIADRQPRQNHKLLLIHSLHVLIRSDSKMLSWPTSPLIVLLEFVDPNVLSEGDDAPLEEGNSSKQLIGYGANVNAVSIPYGATPLLAACYSGSVTNLDLIELLLKEGADPNSQDHMGRTPLMYTIQLAPGAAKLMLNWPTTDASIIARSGEFYPDRVREAIAYFSHEIGLPGNPEKVQHQFLLQQWLGIEEMLGIRLHL